MVQTLFGPQEEKTGLFKRLKKAVASTKSQFVDRLDEITENKQRIDPALLDDLEATLILADLGVTVRERARATVIDSRGVTIEVGGASERIDARTVIWARSW